MSELNEAVAAAQQAIDDAMEHSQVFERDGREVRVFRDGVYEDVGRAILTHLPTLIRAASLEPLCEGKWNPHTRQVLVGEAFEGSSLGDCVVYAHPVPRPSDRSET